jgi:hypothetical protein
MLAATSRVLGSDRLERQQRPVGLGDTLVMSNPEVKELADSIATAARSATGIDYRWGARHQSAPAGQPRPATQPHRLGARLAR